MCNIKYYIDETAAYFGNMLGEKVALESADKDLLERIPMNVSSRFSFYKGCILGQLILMAYLKDGDSVPPAQLKKQLDIIGRQTQLVVVLITPCISSYNKVRLVAQKVNFVIPNRQMFLPSLLLDIKPDRKVGLDLKETIPPFAQCLLLYHLQIESIVGTTGYGLSDKFGVSYATANKSLRWLVSKDLIKLEGTKTKTVQIDISNRELWNKALPMLVSPIEQLYYTDAVLEGQHKREDEKFVTEMAYDNAKFIEDVLRDLVLALRGLDGATWFEVECESFESIHNHSAYAFHEEGDKTPA